MKVRKFILPVISVLLLIDVICLSYSLQNTKNRYEIVMRNNSSEFSSELSDIVSAVGRDVPEGGESEYNNTQLLRLNHCLALFNDTIYKEYTPLQTALMRMQYYCIEGELHKYSGENGLFTLLTRLKINPGDQNTADEITKMLNTPYDN